MTKKNFIIKEYENTSLGDLNSRDILEVEKINKINGNEIFEIKANNIIKAKQFVWIVRINNKNIQVLPKILWEDNSKIIKNLLYMLSYTKKLNIKETDIAKLWKIDDLFEIFIYIFSKELLELIRKDFKKNYNKIEENSNFLKWKLIFSENIKNNLFNKSKFFVSYEKMDENFLLNIFLKSVCNKLIKLTKSNENYKLLSKCIFIFKEIDNVVFTNPSQLNKIKINKLLKEYKNTFSLWNMLYFWNSPDFSENTKENFSFVFDMNSLFEEFIFEFIKKNQIKIDENIENIKSQTSDKYVFKNNKFNLKPDIIINKYNEKIIIDTKYKKLDKEKSYFWVSSADIYQMLTYWMRYFWDYDINIKKNIILLYPDYDWKNYNFELNSIENINIYIKTIKLNFDLSKNDWKKELIEELKNILLIL